MNPWMLLVGCLFLMLIGAVWAIVMVLVFRFAVAVFAVEVAAIAALVNPSLRRANPRAVCSDDDDEIAARHHLHDL